VIARRSVSSEIFLVGHIRKIFFINATKRSKGRAVQPPTLTAMTVTIIIDFAINLILNATALTLSSYHFLYSRYRFSEGELDD